MNEQIFVIRVWYERREIKGELPKFRGMIQHVPTGKKRYLKDLGDIVPFIIPYTKQQAPA